MLGEEKKEHRDIIRILLLVYKDIIEQVEMISKMALKKAYGLIHFILPD